MAHAARSATADESGLSNDTYTTVDLQPATAATHHRSPFGTLPDELLEHALSLVGCRWVLTSAHAVCTRWRTACSNVRVRLVWARASLSVHTGIPHTAAFYGTTDTAEVTAWIVDIARRFRRLAGFPEGSPLTDEARLTILPHTPNLLMYGIKKAANVGRVDPELGPPSTGLAPPARIVHALVAYCPRLVEVMMYGVAATDADIAALALGCRRIVQFSCHDFSLAGTSSLTNTAIIAMATQWAQLKSVILSFMPPNTNICDAAIVALAGKCSGLRVLLIHGVPRLTDVSLLAIANGCPDLREITMADVRVTDAGVAAIARHCPMMTVVRFAGSLVTDATVIKLLNDLPALCKVDLLNCDRLTDASVPAVFAARTRGVHVMVSGEGLSEVALSSINAAQLFYT